MERRKLVMLCECACVFIAQFSAETNRHIFNNTLYVNLFHEYLQELNKNFMIKSHRRNSLGKKLETLFS